MIEKRTSSYVATRTNGSYRAPPPNDDVPLTPGICRSLTCFRPLRMRYSMVRKSLRFTSAHCRRNSALACDVVVSPAPPMLERRVVIGMCCPSARSFWAATRSRLRYRERTSFCRPLSFRAVAITSVLVVFAGLRIWTERNDTSMDRCRHADRRDDHIIHFNEAVCT